MKARDIRLRSLRSDRRGVATVEFALWALLIFATLLPCLDMANYLLFEDRLNSAVGQASILAYNMRNSDTLNTSELVNYIAATAALPNTAPTITATCNGGAQSCAVAVASRQCTCLSGTLPTYTAASACGTACASGATSGYYLTIKASYTYKPMIVPDRWLNGGTMRSSVMVRLQ